MNTESLERVIRGIRPWQIAVAGGAALVLAVGSAAVTAAVVTRGSSATAAQGSSTTTTTTTTRPVVDTTGFPSGGRNPGIFTDSCALTKTLPNDPILMPGMTGMSMQHDFFGNPAVTADSAPADLVGGETSCSTAADASAYWTPVLFQDDRALEPQRTLIYWRAPAQTAASVTTMPAGMTLIAGDEGATAPQSSRIIDWTCTATASDPRPGRGDSPRDCAHGGRLRLVITFPNCWDGHTLDGSERTNVVYASAGNTEGDAPCPASHPVQIPQIVLHVTYPTSSATGLTLSIGPTQKGPVTTGHADFMMGWNQSVMDADVAACVTAQTRCGPTRGPDATPAGGVTAARRGSGT